HFPGEHFSNASNLSAHAPQFFLNVLVAAVDVVNAVDDGFAIRYQGGDYQGSRRAQVGGKDSGSAEFRLAANDGASSFNLDVGAHAHQFLGVHKAILENVLRNHRSPVGLGGQRHVLRLHVGGKAGILFGDHIGSPQMAVAKHANRVLIVCDLHTCFDQPLQHRGEVLRVTSNHVEVATR